MAEAGETTQPQPKEGIFSRIREAFHKPGQPESVIKAQENVQKIAEANKITVGGKQIDMISQQQAEFRHAAMMQNPLKQEDMLKPEEERIQEYMRRGMTRDEAEMRRAREKLPFVHNPQARMSNEDWKLSQEKKAGQLQKSKEAYESIAAGVEAIQGTEAASQARETSEITKQIETDNQPIIAEWLMLEPELPKLEVPKTEVWVSTLAEEGKREYQSFDTLKTKATAEGRLTKSPANSLLDKYYPERLSGTLKVKYADGETNWQVEVQSTKGKSPEERRKITINGVETPILQTVLYKNEDKTKGYTRVLTDTGEWFASEALNLAKKGEKPQWEYSAYHAMTPQEKHVLFDEVGLWGSKAGAVIKALPKAA